MTHRERAEAINRAEWEAERASLMRRAFAYAEQKRMADRARALAVNLEGKVAFSKPPHIALGRPAKRFEHEGHTRTLAEWATHTGIPLKTLRQRMRKARTLTEALAVRGRTRTRR